MKQRLHLARELIGELRSEGRTVLLTTHDMAEAEAVCDRITLSDQGVILGRRLQRLWRSGWGVLSALRRAMIAQLSFGTDLRSAVRDGPLQIRRPHEPLGLESHTDHLRLLDDTRGLAFAGPHVAPEG